MLEGRNSLVGLVDRIMSETKEDKVAMKDLVEAIGHASFTPLLLIPAVAVATPLSGIPLFSTSMGVLIFLVSIQMLLRRDHLWLPGWLLARQAKSARVRATFKRIRPVMAWLDTHTHERLLALVHRPLIFVPQLFCVITGLVMPFLEFVPFSSSLAGVAVALLAFGMLARDGLIHRIWTIAVPRACLAGLADQLRLRS